METDPTQQSKFEAPHDAEMVADKDGDFVTIFYFELSAIARNPGTLPAALRFVCLGFVLTECGDNPDFDSNFLRS